MVDSQKASNHEEKKQNEYEYNDPALPDNHYYFHNNNKNDYEYIDRPLYCDYNDPDLFDMPSLICCRCNKISSLGGRLFEQNNPSHNIGFCIKFDNPNMLCL